MMSHTILQSTKAIEDNFPTNLATRTLAYWFTQQTPAPTPGSLCTSFLNLAGVDSTTVGTLCTGQDWTNIS